MFLKNMGKFNRTIISLFITFCIFFSIIACEGKKTSKHNNKTSDKIGIVFVDKTIMRVDPIIYSSVITYLNKGEILLIISKSDVKEKISNNEDYWYNVRFSRGLTGWVYGANIKIFSADKIYEIKRYLTQFWAEESLNFRKKIAGKWGSFDNGESPYQSLYIFDDGKYKSYRAESAPIEGEYVVNYKEAEIIFKNGTFFGNKITCYVNGNRFVLKRSVKDKGIKFKKISSKIDSVSDEEKKENKSGA
ncbi:MAG: SH3 domain-containing protein [Spirochaetota bacterium]